MKSLIVPLLATASFSTFLICGMVAASSLHLGYTPHKFANLNASIWTSEPVRVDRAQEKLTREAAEIPVDTTADPEVEQVAAADMAGKPAENTPAPAIAQTAAADIGPCQARYKSYRASDNSYQPFDGGPRRQCELSAQPTDAGLAANDDTPPAVVQNSDQDHAGWCEARYSSYRASDDTYQPFNSTDRRRCISPVSMASNG